MVDKKDVKKMRKERDINELFRALESPDTKIRKLTASILLKFANKDLLDQDSIYHLNFALVDSDLEVRLYAIQAVSALARKGIGNHSSIHPLNECIDENFNYMGAGLWVYAGDALWNLAERCNIADETTINKLEALPKMYKSNQIKKLQQKIKLMTQKERYQVSLNQEIAEPNETPNMHQYPPPPNYPPPPADFVKKLLPDIMNIVMPLHVEGNATAEVVFKFENRSGVELNDVNVDFSNMENFFVVEGQVKIPVLSPGMIAASRVRIRSKFEEGVFPFKLVLKSGEVSIENKYTIKVGGTEIY